VVDRADIYAAIDAERAHQAAKYGPRKEQSLPGFLLILRKELEEAELAWQKGGEGRNSAMAEVLQVAAVAVAALEKYGLTGCPRASDDYTCQQQPALPRTDWEVPTLGSSEDSRRG
jgi:hypothetical protein